MSNNEPLQRLIRLMQRLRDPESGCPWDLEQTMQSLLPHTLEEVYELADAIECSDHQQIREELGDYLFQAAFYAQIASEEGLFSLADVVNGLVDKLVHRHPHVFPDGDLDGDASSSKALGKAQIKDNWETLKQKARAEKSLHSQLDDVPSALPALQRAHKLQSRAARGGFDWPNHLGALAKLEEESAELNEAIIEQDREAMAHEAGDLLFTCVNLCRDLGVDAEQVLRGANTRFETRFRSIESALDSQGKKMAETELEELEALWQQAK